MSVTLIWWIYSRYKVWVPTPKPSFLDIHQEANYLLVSYQYPVTKPSLHLRFLLTSCLEWERNYAMVVVTKTVKDAAVSHPIRASNHHSFVINNKGGWVGVMVWFTQLTPLRTCFGTLYEYDKLHICVWLSIHRGSTSHVSQGICQFHPASKFRLLLPLIPVWALWTLALGFHQLST